MKVVIFGVGRSGTTALYHLVQEILESSYPGDIDYVYEPFLWDRDTFNAFNVDLSRNFLRIDSQSVDGMYWHQKIPMFVSSIDSEQSSGFPFISSLLSPMNGKNHLLLKSIRMNGRLPFFENFSDSETRYIFIIRNPVDVVNSAISRFSFFGNNYHKSDEKRFYREVNECHNCYYSPSGLNQMEKQLHYWRHMNQSVVDTSASYENVLFLQHESLVSNPAIYTERICEHLGLPHSDEWTEFISRGQSEIGNSKNNYSKKDFSLAVSYLDIYSEFCRKMELPDVDRDRIKARYTNFTSSRSLPKFRSINANFLEKAVKRMEDHAHKATLDHNKMQSELEAELSARNASHEQLERQMSEAINAVSHLRADNATLRGSWAFRIGSRLLAPFYKIKHVCRQRVIDK